MFTTIKGYPVIYKVIHCWYGYIIEIKKPCERPYYLKKVYNKTCEFGHSFSLAKTYKTEKAAQNMLEKIKQGVYKNV